MSDGLVRYSVLPSEDSAIIMEVLHARLLQRRKYVLAFDEFSGELSYAPNHPENSRLTLEISATSITCRDRRLSLAKQRRIAKRAQELVLAAGTPGTIHFSSAHISAKALRGFAVEGTMTVKGTASLLKMNVMFVKPTADYVEIEGDFMFRFSKFGMKAPASLLGINRLDDEALVQFHLQAARADAAAGDAAKSASS